jgi:hypothetical protein
MVCFSRVSRVWAFTFYSPPDPSSSANLLEPGLFRAIAAHQDLPASIAAIADFRPPSDSVNPTISLTRSLVIGSPWFFPQSLTDLLSQPLEVFGQERVHFSQAKDKRFVLLPGRRHKRAQGLVNKIHVYQLLSDKNAKSFHLLRKLHENHLLVDRKLLQSLLLDGISCELINCINSAKSRVSKLRKASTVNRSRRSLAAALT